MKLLRITKEKDDILLVVLAAGGGVWYQLKNFFQTNGFGTFLSKIDEGEISITQEAYDALASCPYRSGLQGLELFKNNMLAWGSQSPTFSVPCGCISLHEGAELWLEKCCIIE